MPSQPTDVLLIALADRARGGEDLRRNAIGWYANIELTEREFQVLGIDDYLHHGEEIIFLAGKRLRSDGVKEAQIWWARPFCPDCGREGIVEKRDTSEDDEKLWGIDCCGAAYEGALRDVCLSWMGRLHRHPHRDRFPQRRLEEAHASGGGGGTDWEKAYQEETTPWDYGSIHPDLLRLARELPIENGRILVPGCGRGHDAAGLALHLGGIDESNKWDITAVDLSSTALAAAVEKYHHIPIDWVQGDLFNLARIWGERFDWVIEHTCVSGLPPALRDDYVDAVHRYLKPGGTYVGIFLTDTGDPPEVGPPFSFPKEEILERFGANFDIVKSGPPEETYETRDSEELFLVARKP